MLQVVELGAQWPTIDPFLFCAHHLDLYPRANDTMGPDATLDGRDIGMDFAGLDGWRMYHGTTVPGFPQHPHRGFETVTYVRRGFIDHSDSLGATARLGRGDVQWLTAGSGIVHAEMFPLIERDEPNTCELFQIWLNLPRANKMVDPYFTMLWGEDLPAQRLVDTNGNGVDVTVVAGAFGDTAPPTPPPDSWAATVDHEVGIWHLVMEPNATCTLPSAQNANTVRTIYLFEGAAHVASHPLTASQAAVVDAHAEFAITASEHGAEILVLQGQPIGEPVARHGPFVLNDQAGIEQAFRDYQRTQFGGWPWKRIDPVHTREQARFAQHPDGRVDHPPATAARP